MVQGIILIHLSFTKYVAFNLKVDDMTKESVYFAVKNSFRIRTVAHQMSNDSAMTPFLTSCLRSINI